MTQVSLKSETKDKSIAFVDLKAQQDRIRPQIDLAIKKVLDHGKFIMGPEVAELESELAKFCGIKHAITCSNGTDALALGLMAKNVGPGDAVFVPSFTFAASAEVVAWSGATVVFIDSSASTYNMDPNSLQLGIKTALDAGLRPVGIIPVDLFGQPADYDEIQGIARQYNLWTMADAAQSFGAIYKGRAVGSIGDLATTSFFPAKPLGCFGDGGAIFTDDDNMADTIKSLRMHGQGIDKYDNVRIGMNGRLDTLQAAILLEKLKIFPEEVCKRQQIAACYSHRLQNCVQVPNVLANATSTWAQYTVVLPEDVNRKAVMSRLKSAGVPTAVYYVKPLHQQTAYVNYLVAGNVSLPVCERLATRVLSLPISGYISMEDVNYIADEFIKSCVQ